MTELRFTGKTPEGVELTLADQEGGEYTVRISDSLRAAVNQPRLSSVPDEDSQALSVKEIQRRLRAGESAQDIAAESGTSIEKIDRFAGPILQERSYIIDQAHSYVVKKEHGHDPVTLFEAVLDRLVPRGIAEEDLTWSAWRHHDGTWSVTLTYPNIDGTGDAEWHIDTERRSIEACDENARFMSGLSANTVRTPSRPTPAVVYDEPVAVVTEIDVEIEVEEVREAPRLVALRQEPDDAAAKDGITARAKVPSWDEIMFGIPKSEDDN